MDPRTLPIREYTDKIVDAVSNNLVTIVIGETGSGKTTQISQVSPPVPPEFDCCGPQHLDAAWPLRD